MKQIIIFFALCFAASCGSIDENQFDFYQILAKNLISQKGENKWQHTELQLSYELKHTHELCEKLKIDFPTMLAIRHAESSGKPILKASDYSKTKSYGTYQQTFANTQTYGKGKSHKEISEDVFLNITVACYYMRDVKDLVGGYNRQIIAFNKGVKGANALSYSECLENTYLAKVLAKKKNIERMISQSGLSVIKYDK